ncbi:hypothetical protein HAALTHF_14480n [Vreelandella aquamarina]|nr:hypothetical protein HAALTHF_14480n [Halomonas axialensis]
MTFKFDKLYRLGAWGAAACMVAICALIALQVTFRLVDALLVLVGQERLGVSITGVSEMASYLLVGATFLGLAYTFVHHAHIRVTLLISRLPSAVRVWFEVFGLIIALVISVLLAYGLIGLARESLEYNDVSSGFCRFPLWIPPGGAGRWGRAAGPGAVRSAVDGRAHCHTRPVKLPRSHFHRR